MRRTRPVRPQRQRIFVGCEGQSEVGYARLLSELLEEIGRGYHLDIVDLRGGDPLTLAQSAIKEVQRRERNRGSYRLKRLLLDIDLLGKVPNRDREFERLLAADGLVPIWQRPCFEGMLLRHLRNCHDLLPNSTNDAHAQLLTRWPEYRKPMDARRLATRVSRVEVNAARKVEHELDAFLTEIGFY